MPGSGGVFDVEADGAVIFSKHALGLRAYPDPDDVLPALRTAIGDEVA